MANVQAEVVTLDGLQATYNAASAGGDTVPVGEHVLLHIKSTSASAETATITTPNTVAGLAIADQVVNVPAGGEAFSGPIRRDLFAGPGGLAAVAWSNAAALTFAVLRA